MGRGRDFLMVLALIKPRGLGVGVGSGVRSGDGGHESKASLSKVIIDKELGENDLEIFETEVDG
jgi:hypothetical protein